MWYATITETRQTIPPSKSDAEQQSDFPVDQAATADFAVPNQGILWHKAPPCASGLHNLRADLEKACKAGVPGSEYWLP